MVPRWLYELLLVCSGAVVGATLRFLTLEACSRFTWPAGLLLINASGSLLIGVAMGVAQAAPEGGQFFRDSLKYFLVIGVLGSMTTYSAFSYVAVNMLRQGHVFSAFAHISAHLVLCLGACAVGWAATERFLSNP